MSKKGRAKNKALKAARRAEATSHPPKTMSSEALALLITFEALDADPSLTGPDLTPDTWRWAVFGMARRNLLAGYENHNHPINLGEASVPPVAVVEAFDEYRRRNMHKQEPALTSAPQQWQSTLEHDERTALVRHYLRRAENTNPFGDPAMVEWITHFTNALDDHPLPTFATVASYLTGLQHPRLLTLAGPVFAPAATADALHTQMLRDQTGQPSTDE